MWKRIIGLALCAAALFFFVDFEVIFASRSCSDPDCPDAYFATNYYDARNRFLVAAKKAGAEMHRFPIVADDASGLNLTMDVAVIRGGVAEDVLVHTSGVHGLEGYAGSAIQVKLLRRLAKMDRKVLSTMPTIVFIHAVNPFGFAMNRRTNENNVDLNRNHLLTSEDWNRVLQRNPNFAGYNDFRDFLDTSYIPTPLSYWATLLRGMWPLVTHGVDGLLRVGAASQYHSKTGMQFGGTEMQPSLHALHASLEQFKATAKRVVTIHVHTGLGKEGIDTLIVGSQSHLDAARAALPHRSFDCMACGGGKEIGSAYMLTEGIVNVAEKVFPSVDQSTSVDIFQEFGTVHFIRVAVSYSVEIAAYNAAPWTYEHEMATRSLRDCFYVQKLSWKASILTRGVTLFDEALAHLMKQSPKP